MSVEQSAGHRLSAYYPAKVRGRLLGVLAAYSEAGLGVDAGAAALLEAVSDAASSSRLKEPLERFLKEGGTLGDRLITALQQVSPEETAIFAALRTASEPAVHILLSRAAGLAERQ